MGVWWVGAWEAAERVKVGRDGRGMALLLGALLISRWRHSSGFRYHTWEGPDPTVRAQV